MNESQESFGAGNAALGLEAEVSLRAQGEIGAGVSASRQCPESRTYLSLMGGEVWSESSAGDDLRLELAAQVSVLIERINNYEELRQEMRRTSDDDAPAYRALLDRRIQAWERVLQARNEVQL